MPIKKYLVLSPDVWGNEEDGWEVNDAHQIGSIELRCPDSNVELLETLIRNEILGKHVTLDDLIIDGDDLDLMYIERFSDGRPLLHLQREFPCE